MKKGYVRLTPEICEEHVLVVLKSVTVPDGGRCLGCQQGCGYWRTENKFGHVIASYKDRSGEIGKTLPRIDWYSDEFPRKTNR